MSNQTRDFYGKDIAEAIKEACEHLGAAQENLNIEVLETGSKGIFGLIRQKAHIRVSVQDTTEDAQHPSQPAPQVERQKDKPKNKAARPNKKPQADRSSPVNDVAAAPMDQPAHRQPDPSHENIPPHDDGGAANQATELSEASLDLIRDELQEILVLMGCPSTVTVENAGDSVHCRVSAEHQETLVSQEGRVLDSLQYLLRKIVSKKTGARVQLSIDVGDYREKRYQQLRELAAEYAAQVKEDGKTQVIASLNPSERRIVHVALQDDPDIRSRSVGDGLFKKVMIYKPGKTKKNNNRKRGRSNHRKKNSSGRKQEAS